MSLTISIETEPCNFLDFVNFTESYLREKCGAHGEEVKIEKEENRPPSGCMGLKSEVEVCKILVTLLSSGGALAFSAVLKEWLKQRKTKLEIVDPVTGLNVRFEGTINKENKAFLKALTRNFQEKKSKNSRGNKS
jgi:hypothetical protein